MANRDNPHGFQPLMRSITGGPGAASIGAHKLVGDGTALFVNDVVKRAAAGTKKTLCITAATAAAAAFGVNLVYGAASTATDHIVIPGQFQMFEAQEDGVTHGGANVAAVDMGLNANLMATAGDANTKHSKHEIGGASIASTNTLDFHLLGLFQAPDNDFGANARLLVTFNNSQLSNQIAGA